MLPGKQLEERASRSDRPIFGMVVQRCIACYIVIEPIISLLINGGVGYGLSAGNEKGYKAVRIHLAVRNYNCDELIELSRNYRKDNIIQHDIVRFLKNLRVDKNYWL